MQLLDQRWRRLLLLRRWAFGLWIGTLPAGGFVYWLSAGLHSQAASITFLVAYFFSFLTVGCSYLLQSCPNCGESFAFTLDQKRAMLTQPRCVHCGIELGAPLAT